MTRPTGHCKLCLKTALLCESHLIPKRFYPVVRQSEGKHFVVSFDKIFPTDRQVHEYLLCDDCEDRFNKQGENWTIKNALTVSGAFPLRDALRACDAIEKNPPAQLVCRVDDNTPGVDAAQIAYFAASVFWRATHRWGMLERWYEREAPLDFGPYTEPLRLFLYENAPFPNNAMLAIFVSNRDEPDAGISFPAGGRTKLDFHNYTLQIPGMAFMLGFGQIIPSDIRLCCAVQHRIVFLDDSPEVLFKKWEQRYIERNRKR